MSRPRAKMHAVQVTASAEGGKFRFEPKSELWEEPSASLRFHKDEHGLRKQDYHLVEFVLVDQSGECLRFPAVPHDAMWVTKAEAGALCPDRNSRSDYETLEPICVCDGGTRLIVRNDNPRREQWAFTLNFVKRGEADADPENYVSWDPIIDNRDGGSSS